MIVLESLPPVEAIEFFRAKSLAPDDLRFDFRDVWRLMHAEMFVVAKAMRDEVLELLRDRIDAAIVDGSTMEAFVAKLEPELKAAGWWGQSSEIDPLTGDLKTVQLGSKRRLKVIYDANTRSAYAAGRWNRIWRTRDALPFLQYRQVKRPTSRDEHALYDGLVLPVDHPVWQRIYPPNGWFCGCSVRQLSQDDLDREGLSVDDSFDLEFEPYLNARSGEIEQLPKGVDPGWDTNPGLALVSNQPPA